MQIDFVTQPAAERGVFFQQAALKREILQVRDMFFRPLPPFNEVIATLTELE